MGSRGRKRRRRRDQAAETKQFIESVRSDTSISDITRKEFIDRAEANLAGFQSGMQNSRGKDV